MGYVGTAPVSGDYRKLDDISSGFNGSETAFALQVGSVNVTPPKATALLISVGGILQEPVTAYGITASTITFTAAPAAGSDFFGIMLGNQPLDIGSPGDDTVTTAKILDNAVTLAKMAGGTDGNIISYDASGDPVAVATGTDGQVLTSAGAGAPPAFENAGGAASIWQLVEYAPSAGSTWRSNAQNFPYTNSGTNSTQQLFWFSGFMPTGMTSVSKAIVRLAAGGTGDLRWLANMSFMSTADSTPYYSGGSSSIAANTTALSNALVSDIDISSLFGSVAAEDQWGIWFERTAAHGDDTVPNINIFGLQVEYA